jgi:hypothetical protein
MRPHALWAVLALTPLAAPAPDSYVIRLEYDPAPGQHYVVKSTDKFTSTTTVINPLTGKPQDPEKTATEEELAYTETVVEKPAKKGGAVPKFKRAYTKASKTEGGKTAALPYEGRTVVFELKDGKYRAAAEGGPAIDPKALDELAQKETGTPAPPGSQQLFLPARAVRVAEKWTIDGTALAKALPADDTFSTRAGPRARGRSSRHTRRAGRSTGSSSCG